MAKKARVVRKQRTREHVIADLSAHHVEGFILAEGHTAQRLDQDYGYDLVVITYDANGYIETGAMFIQLKASEHLQRVKSDYVLDLDIRDYNLWTPNRIPVILILYEASQSQAFWLPIRATFSKTRPADRRRVRRPCASAFRTPAASIARPWRSCGS